MDVRAIICFVFTLYRFVATDLPVKIQIFKPKGLRVSASGISGVTLIVFEADALYSPNDTSYIPTVVGHGYMSREGHWVYENPDVAMAVGDVLYYRIFTSTTNGTIDQNIWEGRLVYEVPGTVSDMYRLQVLNLEENFALQTATNCVPSLTKVRGRTVCSGQTIFHDDFSSTSLREDLWQIEHYIPVYHPEHPFVSYQRLDTHKTVWVENGKLYIQPRLQRDMPGFTDDHIYSGTLDLSAGCTQQACIKGASGDIVPPVVSGRVTSAAFAFTYGIITVRAKLPQGDWLYPEILLEPLAKKYGSMNYASGVLKVAVAMGNADPGNRFYRHNNNVLRGGPILHGECPSTLDFHEMKEPNEKMWGDDFHDYTLKWTPDGILVFVDGTQYGRYSPGRSGLRSWLSGVKSCRGELYANLGTGGPMAPFDDHFYITLGVAAGGVMEFPEDMVTRDGPKPWRNNAAKAKLTFWQDWERWYPTWNNSALIIDSIKVDAL